MGGLLTVLYNDAPEMAFPVVSLVDKGGKERKGKEIQAVI